MSVTTLMAYCETSVKRPRNSVPPTPPTIASTPTPSGSRAATTDANISTSTRSAMGRATTSPRCTADSSVVLNASLSGTWPVATTGSSPGRTVAGEGPAGDASADREPEQNGREDEHPPARPVDETTPATKHGRRKPYPPELPVVPSYRATSISTGCP